MVSFAPFVGTALLAGFAAAIPMPDSAVGNEVPVSAPNGTPTSDPPMAMATGSGMQSGGGMSGGMMSSGGMSGGKMSSGGMMGGMMSSMMMDSTMMMGATSTMMAATSTMMMSSTATAMATSTYSTPSYGSGNTNWGGSGYNNCVQQCMATYGSMGMGSYMPTATASMGSGSSSGGNGVTHTVIVAPTQGVLRYTPFAVNASVGDTVQFMWGANNHTVTKSSQLALCNKTSDSPFASGTQNKPFMFSQVVNDTNATFFYCGTPGHCQKGMFGIINPPSAAQPGNSVAGMMPAMLQNSSAMAAMASYTSMQTMNNTVAANWGSNMDMSQMPGWAQQSMAENVMYTRVFLAANPDVIGADGTVNMGNAGGNALMVPADITQAANNAASGSSSSATPSATSSSSPSGSASPATAAKGNGARSLSSSGVLVGVVAVLGAFLAL